MPGFETARGRSHHASVNNFGRNARKNESQGLSEIRKVEGGEDEELVEDQQRHVALQWAPAKLHPPLNGLWEQRGGAAGRLMGLLIHLLSHQEQEEDLEVQQRFEQREEPEQH